MHETTRITRRRVLEWLGGIGLVALLPACADDESSAPSSAAPATTAAGTTSASPDCVLSPELTEGPFYLDLDLVRADITDGKEGTPFALGVTVVDADACEPIADAAVDVWHCDAEGAYSGVQGEEGTYLRGIQMTDAEGRAEFRTIFPGWYTGRAVHIHIKVHLGTTSTYTGQLFFDDTETAAVYEAEPYAARGGPDVTNSADSIYGESGGSTVVRLSREGDGYSGSVTLGVQRA